MPTLVTLGSLHLNTNAGPVLVGRRKVLGLLAYLARQSPAAVRRTELIALLWPESGEARGKQSLRQALAELRPILGDALATTAETVSITDHAMTVDATEFEEYGRLERWSDVAQRWTGEFLPGAELLGGDAWKEWVQAQREAIRPFAVRAFELLAAECERTGAHREAFSWSVRWCEVAPYDERAWASRIRALVHSGRPVDAASCYAGFVQALRTAERREPSEAFQSVRSLFAADRVPAAAGAMPQPSGRPAPAITLSLLSQLTVDARSLIEAAAVLGEPATAKTLQSMAELTPIAFRHAVGDLLRRDLLRATDGDPATYAFSGGENRQRVYDVIAADRRRALHRAASTRPQDTSSPAVADQHRQLGEERRRLPFNARAVLTGASILVGAVVLAASIAALARTNALALTAGSTVLLADVRNETGDSLFDGALAAAATIALRQSPHVALHPTGDVSTGRLDEDAARAHAVRANVARVIALGVERSDSQYQLSVRLIDPPSGAVLFESRHEARRAEVVDQLDLLLAGVREKLGESETSVRESSQPLRLVASASVEALDAYARGARANGAGAHAAARQAWQRALALDSAFALAEVALADEAFARSADAEGDAWIQQAATHLARLLPTEAMRVRRALAMRSGDFQEALRLATEVAQRAFTSDAWFDLAAVHLAERDCEEAMPALSKAVGLDSTHVRARLALARCAQDLGDVKAAVNHFTAAQRISPALAVDRAYAREWGIALARAGRAAEAAQAFERLLATGAPLDSAEGLRALAALALYRGRFTEASQMLQHVTRLLRRAGTPEQVHASLMLEAEAFFAIGGRTRASELVDEAVALTSRGATPVGYVQLGLLMTRMGRINGAREVLRQFTARVTPESAEAQWAERLLSAAIQLAERDAAGAMSTLDDVEAPAALEPFRLAATADANALAGHHEAALAAARRLAEGWYLGVEAQDEWMRATLRLARVAEAAGDTATALAAYRRYVDRWKEADGYVVELAGAQRSLARLGGAIALNR